jgi:hypothetical protein
MLASMSAFVYRTDRHAIDEQAIGLVNQDKYANRVVIME